MEVEVKREFDRLYKEIALLRNQPPSTELATPQVNSALGDSIKRSVDQTLIAHQAKAQQFEVASKQREAQLVAEIESLKRQLEAIQSFSGFKSGEVPTWDGEAQAFVPKRHSQFDPSEMDDGVVWVKGNKAYGGRLNLSDIVPIDAYPMAKGPLLIKGGELKCSRYFIEDEYGIQINGAFKDEFDEVYVTELLIHTSAYPKDAEGNEIEFSIFISGRQIDVKPTGKKILSRVLDFGYADSLSVQYPGDFPFGHVNIYAKTLDTHIYVQENSLT